MFKAQSIQRETMPAGHLSGICHFVGPHGGEFVIIGLPGDGALVNLFKHEEFHMFTIYS